MRRRGGESRYLEQGRGEQEGGEGVEMKRREEERRKEDERE